MKTLDRYLLRELLSPFLFALAAFTMIFVSANVLFELTRMLAEHKLGLWDAVKLLVLGLPYFMRYAFPMAMLLGALLSVSKLSSDQEMVAMAAGGVSFTRLMYPFALAGLLVSLVTLAFNEQVAPAAIVASERLLARTGADPGKTDNIILRGYRGERLASLLYADNLDVREGTMRGVLLIFFEGAGRQQETISAESARWRGTTWRFYNGMITFTRQRFKPTLSFGAAGVAVELNTSPLEIARRDKPLTEMSWVELRDLIRNLRRQGAARGHKRSLPQLVVELHSRLALPFASLVFALLAAPLAVRPQRSSRALGFGLSLLIIFAYYIVLSYLGALAGGEIVAPWLAAWLPNVLGLGVAAALIRRQARH